MPRRRPIRSIGNQFFEILRGDAAAALITAKALEDLCREHGMGEWGTVAEMVVGWAHGRLANPTAGAAEMRQALAVLINKGGRLLVASFQGLLADLELETLGADSAVARIDEALVSADQATSFAFLPFLHRLRGDILLKCNPPNIGPAEDDTEPRSPSLSDRAHSATNFSRRFPSPSSTTRPAVSSKPRPSSGPRSKAFRPPPKCRRSPRRRRCWRRWRRPRKSRRTRSDVSSAGNSGRHGNALIGARDHGAPETIEAFAKARESAYAEKDAPERFAADYGLYAGTYTHGELPQARAYAETLLRNVADRTNSPEAGVAQRAVGLTCWFAGEYREARDHLERALALFKPWRDDDLAFRFGWDAGVGATIYLAIVLRPMGDVERAVSLVRGAQTRIAGLSHIGTHALANMHPALFELMRGNFSYATPYAVELARIAREHDLPIWRAFGLFLEGVATTEGRTLGEGLTDMRRGVELMSEENDMRFAGLIKIALAEAEARAGDIDRAIAVIYEALATCERIGHRAFEAELHRARGDILLQRDPANSPPAEEAFLTAIAVSRHQATRSFELRAALALAKLFQSTGRAAEAHAVLAPALEGFAPTPEMPEIFEGHALLASLANTDDSWAEPRPVRPGAPSSARDSIDC
jgi:predicted ATPase